MCFGEFDFRITYEENAGVEFLLSVIDFPTFQHVVVVRSVQLIRRMVELCTIQNIYSGRREKWLQNCSVCIDILKLVYYYIIVLFY